MALNLKCYIAHLPRMEPVTDRRGAVVEFDSPGRAKEWLRKRNKTAVEGRDYVVLPLQPDKQNLVRKLLAN